MSFKKPTLEELDNHQKRAYIASLFSKKVYHRKIYEESLARKRKELKERSTEKWYVIEIYDGSRKILGTYDTYIDAKFACEDYMKLKAILASSGLNPWNYGEFRVVKIKK